MIEFDGQNRIIYVYETDVDIKQIYSRWKDWVLKDLNAMYFQAFAQESNNDKVIYYLINNWNIKQKNNEILNVTGNLIIGEK